MRSNFVWAQGALRSVRWQFAAGSVRCFGRLLVATYGDIDTFFFVGS